MNHFNLFNAFRYKLFIQFKQQAGPIVLEMFETFRQLNGQFDSFENGLNNFQISLLVRTCNWLDNSPND